jgi:hypothetical protein
MTQPKVGQVYADNDDRVKGRTLKVLGVGEHHSRLEVLTNSEDIQRLLDDATPGTRSYVPKDRRGKQTVIANDRLGTSTQRGFTLIKDAEDAE